VSRSRVAQARVRRDGLVSLGQKAGVSPWTRGLAKLQAREVRRYLQAVWAAPGNFVLAMAGAWQMTGGAGAA
jgi:hypothetical protein